MKLTSVFFCKCMLVNNTQWLSVLFSAFDLMCVEVPVILPTVAFAPLFQMLTPWKTSSYFENSMARTLLYLMKCPEFTSLFSCLLFSYYTSYLLFTVPGTIFYLWWFTNPWRIHGSHRPSQKNIHVHTYTMLQMVWHTVQFIGQTQDELKVWQLPNSSN